MASIDSYQTPSFTRMAPHLGSTFKSLPNSSNVFARSDSPRNSERNNQSNSESRNTFTTPSALRLAQHRGKSSTLNPCRITAPPQHTERNRDNSNHSTPPGNVMLEQHLGIFSHRVGQAGNLNTTSRQRVESLEQSVTPRNSTSTDTVAIQTQLETSSGSYSRRRLIIRSSNSESLELESNTQDRLSCSWFHPTSQESSRGGMCIQNNVMNSNDQRNPFSDGQVCQSPVLPPPYESLFLNGEIHSNNLLTSENSSAANLQSSFVRPSNENNDTNATVRENSEESISQNERNGPLSSGQVRLSQHLGSAPRRETFWETLERARLTGQTVDHFRPETQESNAQTGDESCLGDVSVVQSEESGVNEEETEERPMEPPSYSDLQDTWENVNISEAEIEIYEEEQRTVNQNMTSPFYLQAMHYSYP